MSDMDGSRDNILHYRDRLRQCLRRNGGFCCEFCKKEFKGGVTLFKRHLSGLGGDIDPCEGQVPAVVKRSAEFSVSEAESGAGSSSKHADMVSTFFSITCTNPFAFQTSSRLQHPAMSMSMPMDVMRLADSESREEQEHNGCWSSPAANFIKVNVDAAYLDPDPTSSAGAIARDFMGDIVASAARQHKLKWGSLFAEAQAVLLGLELAETCKAQNVIIETDCNFIISLVRGESKDHEGALGEMLTIIRERATSFKTCEWACVPKSANRAAHEVAAFKLGFSGDCFWLPPLPDPITSCCEKDQYYINQGAKRAKAGSDDKPLKVYPRRGKASADRV